MASPAPRLWVRLAAFSVAVALAAVALAAWLTATFASTEVSRLVDQQRDELAGAVAVAAAAAWDQANSWRAVDLAPVLDLAAHRGAQVEVRDGGGHVIATSVEPGRTSWTAIRTAPVTAGGQQIGSVTVRFTGTGIGRTAHGLQLALLRGIAVSSGIAAVLAVLVGVLSARRIGRPVDRVIAAARAMGGGDRAARVGGVRGAPELRELAASFDAMADTVTREEKLRRDLIADVSHELRTPIAVLRAGHDALIDGVIEPTPDQLSSLRDEVLRLARMVEDLHGLATATAAALHLNLTPQDLAEIAAAAADSLRGQIDAAGLVLKCDLQSAPVNADAGWMHQVVANLLGNAIKFTPEGGLITLSVETRGHTTSLRIADTGPGIPADEVPHVFDRFWRGRGASSVAGSGIGLAVVAELVRGHGGVASIESGAGSGTGSAPAMGFGPAMGSGPGTGSEPGTISGPGTTVIVSLPALGAAPHGPLRGCALSR